MLTKAAAEIGQHPRSKRLRLAHTSARRMASTHGCASLISICEGPSSSTFRGTVYRKEGHPDSALNTTTFVFSLSARLWADANITLFFPRAQLKLVKDTRPVVGAALISIHGSTSSCGAVSDPAEKGGHCILLRVNATTAAESSRLSLSTTRITDGRTNPAYGVPRAVTLEIFSREPWRRPSLTCSAVLARAYV